MKLISSAAYAASQTLALQGLSVSRSHLSEVAAALLGYQSLAALQTEMANSALTYHLDDAERLVLTVPLGEARARALGLAAEVPSACIDALKAIAPMPVHKGVSELYDEYAREALEALIADGESTSMAMADSNASFYDAPELDEEPVSNGDLWTSADEWSLEVSGTFSGEYDPDGDRMYNGHAFNVWGKLVFAKAGRAGLIYLDGEEGADADESWRDEDL